MLERSSLAEGEFLAGGPARACGCLNEMPRGAGPCFTPARPELSSLLRLGSQEWIRRCGSSPPVHALRSTEEPSIQHAGAAEGARGLPDHRQGELAAAQAGGCQVCPDNLEPTVYMLSPRPTLWPVDCSHWLLCPWSLQAEYWN